MARPAAHVLYFDDLNIGDFWETDSCSMSAAEIARFAREWDPHPFHVDRDAAKASVFGELCASGLHTMLLTYRQFMRLGLFQGTALAGLGADELRLVSPVFGDDALRVRATVAELRAVSKADRGLLKLRLSTCTTSGIPVLDMTLNMLIARRQNS